MDDWRSFLNPLRISIIGIDGSGKSSTTSRAIRSLSTHFPICKTGRNPFFIWKDQLSYFLPRVAHFFEVLFKRVDATKKRQWIGLTRLLFVSFQGWLEPYMIRRYHPVLIMTTRCMVLDSAIYSGFYYPFLSQKMTMETKLKLAQLYSRLPLRDLYFLLDTPIHVAMERIYKRIADDHPAISYGRDYWLHLHENEGSLKFLNRKFRETLQIAQGMTPFKIVEIDTAERGEDRVAQIISDYSVVFREGRLAESWTRI
jgi:thymidylate kinase